MSARQGSSLWEGWEREAGSRGDAGGARRGKMKTVRLRMLRDSA